MEEKETNNLDIFNKLRAVPKEAKKTIGAGRLKGMTDIKPMWRIEKLTEVFGICGIGWKTKTIKKEIIDGANDEKIAIVDIELYVKYNGEWSDAIEGSGGSTFVAKESKGLYTSDECFKMAYTDALSVACKSLGMGADVYWGESKYQANTKGANQPEEMTKEQIEIIANMPLELKDLIRKTYKKAPLELNRKEAKETIESALKRGLIKTKEQEVLEEKQNKEVF